MDFFSHKKEINKVVSGLIMLIEDLQWYCENFVIYSFNVIIEVRKKTLHFHDNECFRLLMSSRIIKSLIRNIDEYNKLNNSDDDNVH